jgi:hypothetical protein
MAHPTPATAPATPGGTTAATVTTPVTSRWAPTAEMTAATGMCSRSLLRLARAGVIPGPWVVSRSCHRWPIDAVLGALAARAAAAAPTPATTAHGTAEAAA